LSFVELLILVDVEVVHSLLLGLAGEVLCGLCPSVRSVPLVNGSPVLWYYERT
jgi:hypothetical protein